MYLDKNLLNIKNCIKMNEKCSHCGLHYQIEPSFFYGAMYVSYGLNIAVGVVAFIVSFLLLKTSLKTSFISIIASFMILFPIIMRLSRNIYINMFVSFDATAAKK